MISDTHVPDRCAHIPAVILEDFKHADMVIHAGDMVSLEAVEELRSACPRLVAVAGNMDCQAVVKKYPAKQVFEVLGHKIGLMHGCGAPVNLIPLLKDAFQADSPEVIIFGHSHKPMNEVIDGILFFNPGSATDAAAECSTYGIIDIDSGVSARIIKI